MLVTKKGGGQIHDALIPLLPIVFVDPTASVWYFSKCPYVSDYSTQWPSVDQQTTLLDWKILPLTAPASWLESSLLGGLVGLVWLFLWLGALSGWVRPRSGREVSEVWTGWEIVKCLAASIDSKRFHCLSFWTTFWHSSVSIIIQARITDDLLLSTISHRTFFLSFSLYRYWH